MSNINSLIPEKSHYDFAYVADGRVFSYAHQIQNTLSFKPKRVLEVGPGPGVVTNVLRKMGIEVITLDLAPTLNPDIQASVLDIPLEDNSVDIIMCCQVLEHLPFDSFIPALKELRRVANTAGVISLPDISRYWYLKARLPFIKNYECKFSPTFMRLPNLPPGRLEEMGHYWEIGVRGSGIQNIKNAIDESGWKLNRDWRVNEYTWHHFFVLNKS